MSDISYIQFPNQTDADELTADALDLLTALIPEWEPKEGHLEVILIEVLARMIAEASAVAAQVPIGIFRYAGKSLFGIPSIEATRATVATTWTLTDTEGHTIPAGTYVMYKVTADQNIAFRVRSSVVVDAGSSATGTGEVILEAVTPGIEANGLPAGEMYLITALAWVASIESEAATAGGVDAETDAAYLDRLRARLQTLSPAPIVPDDFAILALDVAGVGRAKAVDGFDPTGPTVDNERTVAVALAAADGSDLSTDIKNAVAAYLESLREINFVVHVMNPARSVVNVTATVKKFPEADSAAVEAACEAAVTTYLSPANWNWAGVVRRNELISLLSNVPGVDFVDSLSSPSGDVTMSGVACLPELGTLTITVT